MTEASASVGLLLATALLGGAGMQQSTQVQDVYHCSLLFIFDQTTAQEQKYLKSTQLFLPNPSLLSRRSLDSSKG